MAGPHHQCDRRIGMLLAPAKYTGLADVRPDALLRPCPPPVTAPLKPFAVPAADVEDAAIRQRKQVESPQDTLVPAQPRFQARRTWIRLRLSLPTRVLIADDLDRPFEPRRVAGGWFLWSGHANVNIRVTPLMVYAYLTNLRTPQDMPSANQEIACNHCRRSQRHPITGAPGSDADAVSIVLYVRFRDELLSM